MSQSSLKQNRLASHADLCYNLSRNIVESKDAVNTLRLVTNLLWRLVMDDTVSPHADNGNPSEKRCSACRNFFPATPEYFPRQKSSKDGLKTLCKPCQLEYNHAYYASHRKEISEQRKGYYQEHSHHLREYSAKYREDHPEEVRQSIARYNHTDRRKLSKARYNATHREENRRYSTMWHAEHREEDKEYRTRYNTEHHEKRLISGRRYRAEHREERNEKTRQYRRTDRGRIMHRTHENNRRVRKLLIGGTLTVEQIQEKMKAQRYRCYYCQKHFEKCNGKYLFHLEHTIPLSRTEHNPRHDINYVVLSCSPCNLKKNNRLPHEFFEGGRLL